MVKGLPPSVQQHPYDSSLTTETEFQRRRRVRSRLEDGGATIGGRLLVAGVDDSRSLPGHLTGIVSAMHASDLPQLVIAGLRNAPPLTLRTPPGRGLPHRGPRVKQVDIAEGHKGIPGYIDPVLSRTQGGALGASYIYLRMILAYRSLIGSSFVGRGFFSSHFVGGSFVGRGFVRCCFVCSRLGGCSFTGGVLLGGSFFRSRFQRCGAFGGGTLGSSLCCPIFIGSFSGGGSRAVPFCSGGIRCQYVDLGSLFTVSPGFGNCCSTMSRSTRHGTTVPHRRARADARLAPLHGVETCPVIAGTSTVSTGSGNPVDRRPCFTRSPTEETRCARCCRLWSILPRRRCPTLRCRASSLAVASARSRRARWERSLRGGPGRPRSLPRSRQSRASRIRQRCLSSSFFLCPSRFSPPPARVSPPGSTVLLPRPPALLACSSPLLPADAARSPAAAEYRRSTRMRQFDPVAVGQVLEIRGRLVRSRHGRTATMIGHRNVSPQGGCRLQADKVHVVVQAGYRRRR